MGFGIWSMHFVGMMAADMEMPMQYEFTPLIASIGAAVSGSFVSLYLVSRHILTYYNCLSDQLCLAHP